jgi:hypothetical protein
MAKCAECGFLSIRDDTGSLRLVDEKTRKDWNKAHNVGSDPFPICFVMAAPLQSEVGDTCLVVKCLAVVGKDRPCQSFTPWQIGYSPREHKEMIEAKELARQQEEARERERQFQEDRRRNDREWQDARDRLQEERRKSDQERQDARQDARDQKACDWQEAQSQRNARRSLVTSLFTSLLAVTVGAFLGYFLKGSDGSKVLAPSQKESSNIPTPDPGKPHAKPN